jgi:hypothetical protein
VEDAISSIVKAFINSGPVGLLALGEAIAIGVLFRWLKSVYSTLGAIQERRVTERDAVVTALKSAADALEDVVKLAPQLIGTNERAEATLQKASVIIRALRKRGGR